MKHWMMAAAGACLVSEACSSRPREFTPTLGAAPTDQVQFDAAYAECKQLYVTGKLDSSGRLASGGAGVAAGGAVGVVGSTAAVGAGLYGGMAVASATIVLMPIAVIGGAVGMAKIKRHKKEVAIQHAMSGCLHQHGYKVASWQKTPRAKLQAKTQASE